MAVGVIEVLGASFMAQADVRAPSTGSRNTGDTMICMFLFCLWTETLTGFFG